MPVREADGGESPDLLSGLLKNVRLRGEDIFCCAPRSPFAISFDHHGGTIHVLTQGHFELQLDGQRDRSRYRRGDVVLLPAGRPHTVRNGRRVPSRLLGPSDLHHDTADHATGTRWLTGTFSLDASRRAQLLHILPPVIELRGAGQQSLIWLDVSSFMLMNETTSPTQGSLEIVSRILDLLFIQVVRAWGARADTAPGWLTGAMDPVIGDAITAVHASPAHPWTIERLAGKSNLSRSAFAERLARRVGQPPATYIKQVRLAAAADLLRDSTQSVGAIATEIGSESEAAFSRAFSKHYGLPPSRWRSQPSPPA
jgi:AraC-like DNA-binding protein